MSAQNAARTPTDPAPAPVARSPRDAGDARRVDAVRAGRRFAALQHRMLDAWTAASAGREGDGGRGSRRLAPLQHSRRFDFVSSTRGKRANGAGASSGVGAAPSPAARARRLRVRCACVVQSPGGRRRPTWAQQGAVAGHGADRPWHWETHDIAWQRRPLLLGQAAGLVLATLRCTRPCGRAGASASRTKRACVPSPTAARRGPRARLPLSSYGFDRERAITARAAIADSATMTWALGLLGVLLPALSLLVSSRA